MPEEYYPPVDTHLVSSRHVAQTFKIQVMQPVQQRGESSSFPVVYATDGNLTFDMLKGISHILQGTGTDAPRFILVGIGYPGESPMAGAILRGRDFCFEGYPRFLRQRPPLQDVAMPEEGTKQFYGGEDFQAFIADELIPMIDAKYRTTSGDRTYFGHSAGGGFGLYTLLRRPALFRNYIVSSPGLVFHGTSSAGIDYDRYDFALEETRRFIASGQPLDGRRLYLSVGTEEEFETALANWQLTSSCCRLAALLKAAALPGLELRSETFAGETHATVWPLAFMHGIQAVFGVGRWRSGAPR